MKRQILSALGITILGVASYASTFMEVKTKDGEIVKFDVNDVDEVVFEDETTPLDTTPSSNHEYVDLGLSSGTLWATYNIGATKPEEYGDYFAWGETEPKDVYDWSTYKYATYATLKYDSEWGEYDFDSITKYNMSGRYGIIDSLSTLLSEDDAATANWGPEWRMPTNEEQRELVKECQRQVTEVNGVYGAKFTGKNGNSVFFPAAGCRYGSGVFHKGNDGGYWTSSLGEESESLARYLGFDVKVDVKGVYWFDDSTRGTGCSVRAVRVQK